MEVKYFQTLTNINTGCCEVNRKFPYYLSDFLQYSAKYKYYLIYTKSSVSQKAELLLLYFFHFLKHS